MAYFNQDRKQERAPAIKAILKKYGVKGSLAVRNHMTFVLNIKSGKIDFIENFIQVCTNKPYGEKMSESRIEMLRKDRSMDVNTYWYQEHFDGKARDFIKEVLAAMNGGNHDNSDIQTDYFDVGWYVDVNIGSWDKPYILEK